MSEVDAPGDEVRQILRYLEDEEDLIFEETAPGTFLVRSHEPGTYAHEPVLTLPIDLLRAHLEQNLELYLYAEDRYAEAVAAVAVQLAAALGADHVTGVNSVIAAGVRRGPDGPELFVEDDAPPPEPLDPDDGPYEWTAERPPRS
jgi:hypothetical protein